MNQQQLGAQVSSQQAMMHQVQQAALGKQLS